MIKIQHYEFGKIIINENTYTTDIKIFSNKIKSNWWRKEGHKLFIEDIDDILENKPKILIIGCGANSMLKVDEHLKEYLRTNQIDSYIVDTYEAVKLFNELYPKFKDKLALCVHLTC